MMLEIHSSYKCLNEYNGNVKKKKVSKTRINDNLVVCLSLSRAYNLLRADEHEHFPESLSFLPKGGKAQTFGLMFDLCSKF